MAKKDSWPSLPVRLSQEVDRLFEELIYRPWGSRHRNEAEWSPQLDLYETETAFVLEADLPGVKEDDVSVTVEDNELVLQGQRSFERATARDNFTVVSVALATSCVASDYRLPSTKHRFVPSSAMGSSASPCPKIRQD